MEGAKSEEAAAEVAFEAWRRRSRPTNEIPASVTVDAAIGSSGSLTIFISSLSVYTNGIHFTTEARARGGPGSDDRPVSLVDGVLGKVQVQDRMLFGAEFADGRRCISNPFGREANPADDPLIVCSGGDGGNGIASASWFLSPFPPPGDVRLYCAWPSAGIPETTTIISAGDLLQAASRVHQMWPASRVFDEQSDPSPVALPHDGWFANIGLRADTP